MATPITRRTMYNTVMYHVLGSCTVEIIKAGGSHVLKGGCLMPKMRRTGAMVATSGSAGDAIAGAI